MDLDTLTTMLIDFIQSHQSWAPFIVGALAFAESLAVVSLLVPSTVLLLGPATHERHWGGADLARN